MEGVKIVCHQMKARPLSPPVIEMTTQNAAGLLLDNTLIHIPDSDTPPPTDVDNANQVTGRISTIPTIPFMQTLIEALFYHWAGYKESPMSSTTSTTHNVHL